MTDALGDFEPGDAVQLGNNLVFVSLRVLGRSDAPDFWDGNWISCDIQARAGGFLAQFPANLRLPELARFYAEARRLYEVLTGEAVLESLEDQISLRLTGDGRGHIAVAGSLRDGVGNRLSFSFVLDQTFLFATVSQLAELLNRYPVRGEPNI